MFEEEKERIKNLDKKVFFILSTGRCRSSWFGNFFTYKDSFCYNEESRYITNWHELIDRIEKRPEKYVGFEDPELLHYITTLYSLFPESKYLLLERDKHEAEQSMLDWGHRPNYIIKQKYNRWYKDISVFKDIVKNYETINFNEMDNIKDLERVWKYLIPNTHFDIDRFNLLTALQIKGTLGSKPYEGPPNCLAPFQNLEKLKDIK